MVPCKGLDIKTGRRQLMREGMLHSEKSGCWSTHEAQKHHYGQTPLRCLRIAGCIRGMCLRRSSFKAKHKADCLSGIHSVQPSLKGTQTHTHTKTARTELEMQALTWGRQLQLKDLPPLCCCCCLFYRRDPVGLRRQISLFIKGFQTERHYYFILFFGADNWYYN